MESVSDAPLKSPAQDVKIFIQRHLDSQQIDYFVPSVVYTFKSFTT